MCLIRPLPMYLMSSADRSTFCVPDMLGTVRVRIHNVTKSTMPWWYEYSGLLMLFNMLITCSNACFTYSAFAGRVLLFPYLPILWLRLLRLLCSGSVIISRKIISFPPSYQAFGS